MMKFLRVSVSALVLSTFVIAPVVTAMTANYAYAKNGGGNGNGKGADNGNKGGSADKSSRGQNAKTAKPGNRGKSRNAGKGFGRTVKDDFKSLGRNLKKNGLGGLFTGQTKERVKVQKRERTLTKASRGSSAPKMSNRPPPSQAANFKTDAMHPRNLGKLNGAINSSPNAKLAHIANGQYLKGSGPVSLAAGLAVADYAFADVMGPDNTLTTEQVRAIDAAFNLRDTATLTLDDAEAILADPDAYDPEQIAEAQTLKDAYALTTDDEGADIDRLAVEQIAAVDAVLDAEDDLLDHYKGDFSEDITLALEQQDDVLDAVRASNPDRAMVETSLDAYESRLADEYPEGTTDAATDNFLDETLEEEIAIEG